MTMNDYTLSLKLALKDMISKKLTSIESQTKNLDKQTDKLKKSVADTSAYESMQKKIKTLADHEKKLNAQKQALEKQINKTGTATKKQTQDLDRLSQEISVTTKEHHNAIRASHQLNQKLEKEGIHTKDLSNELARLNSELHKNQNINKKSKGLLGKKGIAVGGTIAASGGAILGKLAFGSAEFSRAAHDIAASTDIPKDQIKNLKKDILEVYTITGQPIDDIKETLRLVNQQMHLNGNDLKHAAIKILFLKRNYQNLDINEIVRASSRNQANWGKTAEESINLVSTALRKAGDPSNDLLDSFQEYSAPLKDVGLTAEQVTATLIQGVNAGARNFDRISDVLKETFKAKLTDKNEWDKLVGKENKKGVIDELLTGEEDKAVNEKIKKHLAALRDGIISGDQEEKNKAVSSLYITLSELSKKNAQKARNIIENVTGTIGAEELSADVLKAMGEGIRNHKQVLGDWQNDLKRQNEKYATLWTELGKSGRDIYSIYVSAIDDIGTALEPVGRAIANITGGVVNLLKSNPGLAKFTTGLLAIGTAAGGILTTASILKSVSQFLPFLSGASTLFAKLATGIKLAGSALLFLSRGLLGLATSHPIIAGITAITTGLIVLYNKSDRFRALVNAIGKGAITAIKTTWDYLKEFGSYITDFFKSIGTGITNFLSNPLDAIKSKMKDAFGFIGKFLPGSDAEIGPLSNLTNSGKAIPETLAKGIQSGKNLLGMSVAKMAQNQIQDKLPVAIKQPSSSAPQNTTNNSKNIQPNFTISINPSIQVSGNQPNIKDQIINAFMDCSTELVWAIENALSQIVNRNAYA